MAGLVPAISLRYARSCPNNRDHRVTPLCGGPAMTIIGCRADVSTSVSPLAPTNVPDMPAIAGVRLATAQAGIRYANRTDVLLALFDAGTSVAGVFTKSKCPSAPVEWCRAHLKSGKARALVVNSGNANAFTGKSGRVATKLTADIAAKAAGCKPSEIFLASTGVIGEPLDGSKFAPVMQGLVGAVAAGRFPRRGKSHHDHRHVSKSRDRDGEDRQARRSPSTASPKAPA